jgi:large subunit ribosomal protein L25
MSMEIIKLTATPRPQSGKGPANRLRREGLIPAVAYGKELQAVSVAVSPKAVLKVLTSDHGQNSVVELAVEGGDTMTVMVRDYSYHPISRDLMHADFVQVKLDQPVDVEVPFRAIGKSKGVILGGILQQIYRRIPVRSLPDKIPAAIEIDITDLGIGDSLKANQITLPEGVKLRVPDEQTVIVVNAPEKAGADEEAAQAASSGAAAAAAPGAAAAPAAGGAAPAAAAPAKGKDKK